MNNFGLFRDMIRVQKIMSPPFPAGDCSLRISVYQSTVGGKEHLSLCLESKVSCIIGWRNECIKVSALPLVRLWRKNHFSPCLQSMDLSCIPYWTIWIAMRPEATHHMHWILLLQ